MCDIPIWRCLMKRSFVLLGISLMAMGLLVYLLIRGGEKAKVNRAEMEELVRALEQCTNPRTCPHGRPTMIHLSVEQLAREFGR